jgi:hypothetical protein
MFRLDAGAEDFTGTPPARAIDREGCRFVAGTRVGLLERLPVKWIRASTMRHGPGRELIPPEWKRI